MNPITDSLPSEGDLGPERTPLVRLATSDVTSRIVDRIVSKGADSRGPGRVAVAAFNSSV